ncbi:MAG TPA: DUF6152 family protein [Steroidobacteraceae bacterium]|nr:DUF6152 family protein [Steroidobacteraceae bacterium]
MKPSSWVGVLLALGALGAQQAVFAHHSYAMFDRARQVALVGTVKQFRWSNPHAWMEIYVPNDQGGTDLWGIEMNSPNNLAREGFRSNMVKPGDKVTVVIHPLRSGEKGGSFMSVTLPNGRLMADAPPRTQPAPGSAPSAAPAAGHP